MKRRCLYLALATVLVAGLWGPIGTFRCYLKGEAFYRGRPASYWSRELKRWHALFVPTSLCGFAVGAEARNAVKRPSQRFYMRPLAPWQYWAFDNMPRFRRYLLKQPPILEGDPAAFNVLVWLLEDESPQIRQMAADKLGRMKEKALLAVPALRRTLGDRDADVREQAEAALREIEQLVLSRGYRPGRRLFRPGQQLMELPKRRSRLSGEASELLEPRTRKLVGDGLHLRTDILAKLAPADTTMENMGYRVHPSPSQISSEGATHSGGRPRRLRGAVHPP